MNRLLALPVIAGALLLSAACSSDQTVAAAPSAAAPSAAAHTEKTGDAPTPAATKKKAVVEEEEKEDATFPIGAGKHMVILHSYSSAKDTAVVEPAEFTDGGQSYEGDGSTYTLPVNPSLNVFSVNGGNPECLQGKGRNITGTCMAGVDWLEEELAGGAMLVTIANTGDSIYEIAEQYRP
ncbi:hypothetical protein [Symbioplanes lichenis]|uniref:hypothetical protein n=1 Tax=Symbioplanes lichenis TaxID=1629072 RepID=UPI00273A5965|nr:hypothetical protein [Actinoplanes lichenis]